MIGQRAPRSLAFAVLLALSALFVGAGTAPACSAGSDCLVVGGAYRIRMPDQQPPSRKIGAVLYFHADGQTANSAMADARLVRQAAKHGAALIALGAPDGAWPVRAAQRPGQADFAYVGQVLDDALARFPLDRQRVMAAGSGLGGEMVWHIACSMRDRFAGFAAIAGAFKDPLPDDCLKGGRESLPYFYHVHDASGRVVPARGEGRGKPGDAKAVTVAVDVWLRPLRPTPPRLTYAEGPLACTLYGNRFEVCLDVSGQDIGPNWIGRAWKSLAEARGWRR